MGTYHVLASCMLLYVSLTCNLMQNYYKKKKVGKKLGLLFFRFPLAVYTKALYEVAEMSPY